MRIIFIYPCVSPLFVVEITNNALRAQTLERFLSSFFYNETHAAAAEGEQLHLLF